MSTYPEIKAQMAALQAQADVRKQAELQGVIDGIRELMREYDLTPAQLAADATRDTGPDHQ
jgi:hypothetical protein